jgi:hypothetical protein
MSKHDRIPVKFKVTAQIIPTSDPTVNENTHYDCSLEKSEFHIKNSSEVRMPLTAVLRKRSQDSSSSDVTISDGSSHTCTTAVSQECRRCQLLARNQALCNLATDETTIIPISDSRSGLSKTSFCASDFSDVCFPSPEQLKDCEHINDPNVSRLNSSIIKWVQVKRRSRDDGAGQVSRPRATRATKLVVAINLNNLRKPAQSEKSVQPLKQGFRNLKDTLKAMNIDVDGSCASTPGTSPRVSAEIPATSVEPSPRISMESEAEVVIASSTPRRSPLLEQHLSVFQMQRTSDDWASERESYEATPQSHLADADPLSKAQMVETIYKEFDQVEDEERVGLISEPNTSPRTSL